MLFEAVGERITQQDFNAVMRVLGPVVGKKAVVAAVGRLLGRQEVELAKKREGDGVRLAVLENGDGEVRDEEFVLRGEDFWDTEEEDDEGGEFGEDDEDEVGEGDDEDGGDDGPDEDGDEDALESR